MLNKTPLWKYLLIVAIVAGSALLTLKLESKYDGMAASEENHDRLRETDPLREPNLIDAVL